MTNPLPSGTVTFLFTDIEGSTKLAQELPDTWEELRKRHHAILHSAMDSHNGYVFQIIGDAFCVAFNTASEAIRAAINSQKQLYAEPWSPTPIKVRMGLHTGQAEVQENGDYQGYLAMSRVQRLMSAGHGGQTLISMATQELIRDELPEKVSLRDMGERRLKDLIRPEHIYQIDITGLPVDFPPLKTLDKYRHNLPTQLTSFIGREKEMAEIKQALAEHRLVTLTGSGGAGKTRLSLQVAADSLDQFPSGIWFVELAPLTNPELIPQTILIATEMQTQQGKSALDSLTDFLREKTSLVVLDNCEHLIEACAKIADALLNAAPNLKILASSREALGIKGEQAWRVPSLSAPDIKHLLPLEQLSQYEAVRLFIDRALLVQPHFVVTNQNAPAVAQICYRLDGIPLAIELAAARIRILTPERIAERLDNRFHLLIGGSRTALPRQQTLRALIDWSYDMLPENERTLLRRLSVFAGGYTLKAAEQVCSDDQIHAEDVLDLLTHLVDKSLAAIDEQPSQLRYRMLETVRQYSREKLFESGEGEKIRMRHFAYFLKFAEEAKPHLGRKEQLEWFEQLELDHENLRTALDWCFDIRQSSKPEDGLRLLNALARFWYLKGYWSEGKEYFTLALSTGSALRNLEYAEALDNAAVFESDSRQWVSYAERSLNLFRELDFKSGIARALFTKAIVIYFDDVVNGKALLEESSNLYLELGDNVGIAWVKYHLGQIASWFEYNDPKAQQYYEETLHLAQDSGDRRIIALANMNLGGLFMKHGDLTSAQESLEKSLSLGHELGDKHGISMYLSSLGEIALGQGRISDAEELLAESLSMSRELGYIWGVLSGLIDLGRLDRFRGNLDQAQNWIKEYLAIARKNEYGEYIALGLCQLGELARLQGNYMTACSNYVQAITIAKENNARNTIAYLLEEVAALEAIQGQAKSGILLFGAAEALHNAIQNVLLPIEKTEVDKNIAATRAQLDETAFESAWVEGRAMSIDQAVVYALESLQASQFEDK